MPAPLPSGRVQLLGIDERSPGVDPVLAGIFQTMRASIGVPPADLARLLHTRPEVVANLEAGRVRSLPPLPELVRLMQDYGALLNIDTDPIIQRIREQTADRSPPLEIATSGPRARNIGARLMAAGETALQSGRREAVVQQNVTGPVPPSTRQAATSGTADAPRGRAEKKLARSTREAKRWRALGTAAIAATLILGAAWTTAQSQTPVLYAAVDQLPPGIAKSLRRGIDMIALSLSTTRDGLTWIETSDPRRRKSDKLPVQTAVEPPRPNR